MIKKIRLEDKEYTLEMDYKYPKSMNDHSATMNVVVLGLPYERTYSVKKRYDEKEMGSTLMQIETDFINYMTQINKKDIFAEYGWK